MARRIAIVALVLCATRMAHAEDVAPPPPTPPESQPQPPPASEPQPPPESPAKLESIPDPAPEPVALPLPDQASGVAIDEPTPAAEKARWIPRVLLFVPRWAFWAVMQPVRLGAYAYEHYLLAERVKGALFSVDQTYGIYPVASYSTDYGVSFGARVVHYNLFGEHERLRLLADFGGEFQQGYGFKLTSGDRFTKRFVATVEARYQRRPGECFYGIGNRDPLPGPPAMLIDPSISETAVSTRFREDLTKVAVTFDAKLIGPFSARAVGVLAFRSFSNDEADPERISASYDTDRLVGFNPGVQNLYVEGELMYATRRPTSKWMSQAIDAAGWYVAAHYGRAKGVGTDTTDFFRYGGEVQRYIDLWRGSRVLALRVTLDKVGGTDGRSDGKISFIDLPRLGGPDFLRGYPNNRYRDRALILGTAEYSWDLGNYMAGYLFMDAGRVAHNLADVPLKSLNYGFGGGVQFHSYRSYIMRAQLAISDDGDVFVELTFSPSLGRRDRGGRL